MTVFLENTLLNAKHNATFCFSSPVSVIKAMTLAEVDAALLAIDAAVANGFWVAGYMAYEAGYAFEENTFQPISTGQPLIEMGVFTAPIFQNVSLDFIEENSLVVDKIPNLSDYQAKIEAIKSHIFEGEVYQINYTTPIEGSFTGSGFNLYQSLKKQQKTAYSAYLKTENQELLSLSPELFFHRKGNQIHTQPMKGTAQRGETLQQDAQLATDLQNDAKNKAENLMIVDLLRNDLSMICETGSVKVPHLFETDLYETVIQMTSTVEGTLKSNIGYSDIFKALFPCGSVTGAPKLRAMQLIQDLEAAHRGVYCGSIGYISPHQEAVFNVAIRTLTLTENRFKMGIGSGIVWDSIPADEYAECLLKAKFLSLC